MNIRGSYHLNELIDAPDEWDFYAGVSAGFYFWRHKYTDVFNTIHRNSGGRPNIGIHAGARYFVNENIAINAELGGGSALSGGTIGVTFIL